MPDIREQETEINEETEPDAQGEMTNEPACGSPADSRPPISVQGNVSQERANILSIVKGLEAQVETAFKLKERLEIDLQASRRELSEESAARAQLQQQVQSLGERAALVSQLQQEIAQVKEESNSTRNLLVQTESRLERAVEERNSLRNDLISAEALAVELRDEKTSLELRLTKLDGELAEVESLRAELAKKDQVHVDMTRQVEDLSARIQAAEASNAAVKSDLAAVCKTADSLRDQAEQLRQQLTDADRQIADLRASLVQQQATNKELMEAKNHLEGVIRVANNNREAARTELGMVKDALRDIRGEALRISDRIAQRYFNSSDGSRDAQE